MSTVVGVRRQVRPGVDQLVLRSLVVLGATASSIAAEVAGARPNGWATALLSVFAVVLALRPDSSAGAVLLVGLAYLWSTTPHRSSALVLVAAAGMLLAHLAAQLAAQGPAVMRVDAAQVRRLCWRGALLWSVSAAVWSLTRVARGLPEGRLVYALGLTVLLALATSTTRLIGRRR